jgi:hypothetical protein
MFSIYLSIDNSFQPNLFTKKNFAEKALLNWTTTGETNNDHFDIQRSGSNTDFATVGTVKGNGTTSQSHDYTFTDDFPVDGNNFYRLREVDKNGNFLYSPVVPVKFNFEKITFYPNPAHYKIYIHNNENFSKKKNLNVRLLDYSGKVLYNKQFQSNGVNIFTVNIPQNISNGIYVLTVTNAEGNKQGDMIYINR